MCHSKAALMLLGLFSVAFLAPRLDAAEPGSIKKLILPGEAFLVEGRPAFILLPPEGKRQKLQPWVFYAPTLAGYPDEHEKWMHEQFLAAGVAVAGIDVGEGYGSPKALERRVALRLDSHQRQSPRDSSRPRRRSSPPCRPAVSP